MSLTNKKKLNTSSNPLPKQDNEIKNKESVGEQIILSKLSQPELNELMENMTKQLAVSVIKQLLEISMKSPGLSINDVIYINRAITELEK